MSDSEYLGTVTVSAIIDIAINQYSCSANRNDNTAAVGGCGFPVSVLASRARQWARSRRRDLPVPGIAIAIARKPGYRT